MGCSTERGSGVEREVKHRSWTAEQKIAIVLVGLRGDRSVKEFYRRCWNRFPA
jgi:hypothetical protein